MSNLDSVATSQWFVQVLFGRYQSASAISWSEGLILAAVGVALIYLYIYLLRLRFGAYENEIRAMPLDHLPLTPAHLTRRMYALLINDSVRVSAIFQHGVRPTANVGVGGDKGWGKISSLPAHVALATHRGSSGEEVEADEDVIHFNTSIAKSYLMLEQIALTRRPGLTHRASRTIRDYIAVLKQAFPRLYDDCCERYLAAYELAVFSNHQFDRKEYADFVDTVLEMTSIIGDRPAYKKKKEKLTTAAPHTLSSQRSQNPLSKS